MSIPSDPSSLKNTAVNTGVGGDPGKANLTQNSQTGIPSLATFRGSVDSTPYDVSNVTQNWYQALPYGFRFFPRNSTQNSTPFTFYLPISPSDITVVTHFATNVIPTLYGTVEEHSEQRYYDITITGTTGIAPKYVNVSPAVSDISNGRAGQDISILGAIGPQLAGGFFAKTLGQVNNILNKVVDTAASVIPGIKTETAGVDLKSSGYVAFHRFYKFLLAYKRDVSGLTSQGNFNVHPLKFINYKDHCMYDCAIQRFSLSRNAKDPLLYNYNIVMRAYNLQDLTGNLTFRKTASTLDALGLNGKSSSVFSKVKGLINGAKSAVGGALSAGSGAGLKGLTKIGH